MRCCLCKRNKDDSEYYVRASGKKMAGCIPCQKRRRNLYYKKNKAQEAAVRAKYYLNNSEKIRIYSKNYQINNRERLRPKKAAIARAYYRKHKSKVNSYFKEWVSKRPGYLAFIKANAICKRKKRMFSWLTKDQIHQIYTFYQTAAELQWLNDPTDKLVVDHIVPIHGINVSGLHMPWNLQIITNSENSRKANKLI